MHPQAGQLLLVGMAVMGHLSRQQVQAWASCRAVPLLMRVLSPAQVQAGRLNWMQSYMQDLGLTACAGMCAAG